jgi:NADH-quinone oxidoreductase subunit K
MIPLWNYLAVGAMLFGIGLVGFLTRRNLITMFLSAELMLLGVVLNFLAFARFHGNLSGQIFGLVIITVAACEAGLAMALIIVLYRRTKSLDASIWQTIREDGLPVAVDSEPLPLKDAEEPDPTLQMAGMRPGESGEVARV